MSNESVGTAHPTTCLIALLSALIAWPTSAAQEKKMPTYRIYPLRNGVCKLAGNHAFYGGNDAETYGYALYLWLILGGVKQLPEERTPEALRRYSVDPAAVSHVIATHLHADHYDYLDAFPNARFVVNRREYEQVKVHIAPDVKSALSKRPDALQLVEDDEIVPGVRVFPLGCHSTGSQGVLVQTHMGPVVLTGDVVYKYENIEKDRPTRSPDPAACREAMAKIRSLADIVLPGHDPLTLTRWPGGVIGDKPRD